MSFTSLRCLALLLGLLLVTGHAEARAASDAPDLVVAADGSGDFLTVQAAIDSVGANGSTQTVISIKPGVYKERIRIPADKKNLKLVGESYENTVLTYDDYAGKNHDCASTRVDADDFFAEGLTFQNTVDSRSGVEGGQAVALRVDGDRAQFVRCRLTGFQDTYYTGGNRRSYHKECVIEGTTDFIYGDGVAVFEDCVINCRKNSHITAHGQTLRDGRSVNRFGYVFKNCDLRLHPEEQATSVSLGRPWRDGARVVYLNCTMGGHIRKEGWSEWQGRENHKTAYYAEYNSRGPGGDPVGRLPWTHQLTDEEAAAYTTANIFAADSTTAVKLEGDWDPEVAGAGHETPTE
ncbi:Pectinesterase A precursor [Botrimarina colliarenosi]|uniref:Pectinesterase A n=1 Tax=Botrimarina colliarenosi TaxID=2528001 RepID=A0A5C6A4Y6_9BACT|nr:pectinesterase family protein [Botrimarina colliarenosi]TWT93453.1 Pectinesterase A precursor [Botrimarina colliarenosi]